jgi:hypothetical protein
VTRAKPRKEGRIWFAGGDVPVRGTLVPPTRPKARRAAVPYARLLAERRKAIEQCIEALSADEREYARALLARPARRPTKWSYARRLQVLAEVDAALATGASREQALQMSADTHRVGVTEIERQLIDAKKLQARDGERLAPPRKPPQK